MSSTFRFLPVALVLGASACRKDPPPAEPAPATVPAVARTIMEAADQYLTRDSARLRYREAGQGEAVVILHGYTQRIEAVKDLADSLSGSYRVIVLDERGFGESTKFGDPARYGDAFGDDVVALLDQLQIQKAHLVGHSMGAAIAADVAVRYPTRVSSISLLAGPFYADSAALARKAAPYVASLRKGTGLTSFVKWLVPGIPDSAATDINRQLLAANDSTVLVAVLSGMGGLTVPAGAKPDSTIRVLIAVGETDPLLPQSRALKALWPKATLIEAKGSNHFDVITRGEVVAGIRTTIRGT
jgi:pimeloyl-ACP methyl ester carboxylesterase